VHQKTNKDIQMKLKELICIRIFLFSLLLTPYSLLASPIIFDGSTNLSVSTFGTEPFNLIANATGNVYLDFSSEDNLLLDTLNLSALNLIDFSINEPDSLSSVITEYDVVGTDIETYSVIGDLVITADSSWEGGEITISAGDSFYLWGPILANSISVIGEDATINLETGVTVGTSTSIGTGGSVIIGAGDNEIINTDGTITIGGDIIGAGSGEVINLTTVPLPATVWLFGSALIGLISVRRRPALAA
jgi:PEP-CTERM motif-containing protein